MEDTEVKNRIESAASWAREVAECVGSVILDKADVVEKLLVALLCDGHVLLEDVPGTGKTVLARALARSMDGTFARVQCTPDLLPTDITGVSVYNPKDGVFTYRAGPIHANIVLVDEINRATPRTQSALLEGMAERQVTVDGNSMRLPDPFLVIATENPIEFEGTFPLPEAQKDRFFVTLRIGYASVETELRIVEQHRRPGHPLDDVRAVVDMADLEAHRQAVHEVFVQEEVKRYLAELVDATRYDPAVQLGVSTRGTLALFRGSQALAAIRGRTYVIPDDVQQLFIPVCEKRVIIDPEHVYRGITPAAALSRILDAAEVPPTTDV